ncbi:MAG: rod shape-determining protein MreD [Clostridia bacterium]
MKAVTICAALAVSAYMDSIFFARVNLFGIRPDMTLAVLVSISVLSGSISGALIGGITGLIMDILFGKLIGLNAIAYMIAGTLGGLFCGKFYADNVIIPTAAAMVCALIKEHIMALSVIVAGGRFSYINMLVGYVLPCVAFTGGISVLVHLIIKPLIIRQSRRYGDRSIGGAK